MLEHDFQRIAAVAERPPQVSARDADEVARVLNWQRLIEAPSLAIELDHFGRRILRQQDEYRVAGRTQEDEHGGNDQPQREYSAADLGEDEPETHAASCDRVEPAG